MEGDPRSPLFLIGTMCVNLHIFSFPVKKGCPAFSAAAAVGHCWGAGQSATQESYKNVIWKEAEWKGWKIFRELFSEEKQNEKLS